MSARRRRESSARRRPAAKSVRASSQNGLGSRGAPSSPRPRGEAEPPRGARARGVEEVAVAGDRVGAGAGRGGRASAPPRLVVEERRGRPARQAALLQPEQKTTSERRVRARSRSSTAHTALLRPRESPASGLERGDQLLAASAPASPNPRAPRRAADLLVRAQVEPRARPAAARRGRTRRSIARASSRTRRAVVDAERTAGAAAAASARAQRLLLDPVGARDASTAQPPLQESACARRGEYGERRNA